MSNKIMHVELASADIAATADFYRALFAWKIEVVEGMDYTMTFMEEGDTTLGFTPLDESQSIKRGDVLVYVDVADIDVFIARARELAAPILMDKMEIPNVGWMAMVGDPGGNRICAMQQMPAG